MLDTPQEKQPSMRKEVKAAPPNSIYQTDGEGTSGEYAISPNATDSNQEHYVVSDIHKQQEQIRASNNALAFSQEKIDLQSEEETTSS